MPHVWSPLSISERCEAGVHPGYAESITAIAPKIQAPRRIGARYLLEAHLVRTKDYGSPDHGVILVTDNERELAEASYHLADNSSEFNFRQSWLCWAQFYIRLGFTLKHSAQATALNAEIPSQEECVGKAYPVGGLHFVVDRQDDGLTWLSGEAIAAEGTLRSYMAEWMGHIAEYGALRRFDHLSELEPFYDMLPNIATASSNS